MQAIKKQWFTLLLMIIQAVMIIFIQPEIGSVSLCNLMFIAIFADDERNVFLKLAWEDKFYFYVQCIVMYLMTLIFGLILALDHGSGSLTVTTKAFNALQMINIIYPKAYYDIWTDRTRRRPKKIIFSQCANVGILCSYSNCI